jgi:short-subunit dehydrogenase
MGRRIELRGSTALVTGASAGIGLAVARRLAQAGANVVLAARRPDILENAAAAVRAVGVQSLAVSTDVSRREALEALVDRAIGEFGTIDVLVNNAGVEAFHRYEELPLDRIAETIAVNLTSALLLTRLVIPHMLAAGRGHVVNMASTAGKFGIPYGATYGTTKAGLINFTHALRAEYRGRGISASAICPGFIGSTTVDRVAEAVIRAIEHDRAELIVNWPPVRPMTAFAALFPTLGGALIRRASVRFLKRVAQSGNHD